MQFLLNYISVFSVSLFIIPLLIFLFFRLMKKIELSQVLIKTSVWDKHEEICRHSAFVIPFFHHLKYVDLSTKEIVVERVEHESLRCKDGIRIELLVEFKVGVHPDEQHIRWVAEKFDGQKTFDTKAVEEYLQQSLLSALKASAQNMALDEFTQNDEQVKKQILDRLANESMGEKIDEMVIFGGYRIYEVSIHLSRALDRNAYNPDDPEDLRGLLKLDEKRSQAKLFQMELEEQEKMRAQELYIAEQKLTEERKQLEQEFAIREIEREKKQEQELQLIEMNIKEDIKHKERKIAIESQKVEYQLKAEEHALYLEEMKREYERKEAENIVILNAKKREQELSIEADKLKEEPAAMEDK
jgi:hypothetical protein